MRGAFLQALPAWESTYRQVAAYGSLLTPERASALPFSQATIDGAINSASLIFGVVTMVQDWIRTPSSVNPGRRDLEYGAVSNQLARDAPLLGSVQIPAFFLS
jgi:hypothetical protein